VRIPSNYKLFVRLTSQYLCYGTYISCGGRRDRRWKIFRVSLDGQRSVKSKQSLVLDNFHGSEIGNTVAFEIFNNYFYAVSNQGTSKVEEIDWTSFYHCVRLPLDDPVSAKLEKNDRVFRRQHAQGPIDDSWTSLSLQNSERTNEVLIVESRCEWEQASSRQSRTFYTSKFVVKKNCSFRASSPLDDTSNRLILPEK
jgi:hypothetical protein